MSSHQRLELAERISIGRAPTCDVQIDDPMVSANHAEIVRQADGTFVVRDLGSRRGTFVGSRKIGETMLHDGDELMIGPIRLRFEATGGSDRDELRKLRAVTDLSRAIGVEHDLDRLLSRVLATCFQLLRADRGSIIVFLPGSKTPCATVALTRDGQPVANALSTSVLSQIMQTREPYLRTEIDGDLALQRSASLSAQGVRSLIAVPLVYQNNDEWLGVIQLDSQASNNVFGPRDVELLEAIGGQAALAIKNAMLVRQLHSVQSDDWRRLERVVRSLPVGVVVLDDQRRCVLANEWVTARSSTIGTVEAGAVVERLAGVASERLIGSEVRDQVSVGTPERTYTLAAHTSTDGDETVIVLADISDERDAQTKAAHRDRLALVGQLAGGIAHDFNNLLYVILNYANLIEESTDNDDLREDAKTIAQTATSAADLVRQLLAFSRRETVKPKVIDVSKLVTDMDKMFQSTLGSKIELELSVADARVRMDASQLEQIVMNLVVNARDAMPDGGRVTVAVARVGDRVALDVSDTGTGMSPEVIERVFEPYFTTKARGKGTGLGLATVHGIVQHAGGEITVRSEVGKGTSFRVTLPATDHSLEADPTQMTTHDARGRVLLVDDDDAVRRLTERMLRRAGYDVVSAASGPEALATVRREAMFDLMLTDMVMPGMSGRDLAREMMRESPGTRVVF
ncbi:MAG TPA: ATP-binding protein, partial [Kofleriaceae bacterium]|nr:ATP-binding protein [Kofleriaceae bacterium]